MQQYKASAPGSLMLLGEHAVLYGKHALVCAVDKRIHVTVTPRNDERIEIHSDRLGSYSTTLQQLHAEKPFQFVLGTLKHYQAKLKRGCDIDITSEFSDQVGLGSSAAVTAATLAALVTWLGIRISPFDLVRQGRLIIRHVQGMGSGADVAASVYGGIVGYQAQPLSVEKFTATHPLTVLYAGYKTPTADVVKHVQDHFYEHPNLFRHLTSSIGQCALDGIQYVRKSDWVKLGQVMTVQQGLMEALGVSTPLLHGMADTLRQQTGIMGAKISGAGLGDCVVGLGALPESHTYSPTQHIPLAMTLQGVHGEKI